MLSLRAVHEGGDRIGTAGAVLKFEELTIRTETLTSPTITEDPFSWLERSVKKPHY